MISNKKTACCACTACAAVCPTGAITMVPDADGFRYPQVDEGKCVHCGLCERVCAYGKDGAPVSAKETYAAVSGDTDLTRSASGGIFASLAQAVLADGGAVFGAAMVCEDGLLTARHMCVTEREELIRLKGSKYLQSDMGDTYRQVRERLEAGQAVLFSGTPCQVAGLKSFLQKDFPLLFTVEIVCHGVPSAKLFRDYLAYEEAKRGAKITAFRFRDKSGGWQLRGAMELTDDEGKTQTVTFPPEESSYYQLFLNGYTYRENCYSCPYASDYRAGDVTIGDYWGIELVHPELLAENGGEIQEKRGVSCLIVNGEKGRALLDRYGGGIRRFPSSYDKAARYNRQLTAPSEPKAERDTVLALARKDYLAVERWYRRRLRPIKVKRALRRMVPRWAKKLVKRWIKEIR